MNQIPKESIIKLQQYLNKQLIIHFNGGRMVQGVLKSYDNNLNVILDDCIEFISDSSDANTYNNGKSRQIGLSICRGTLINYFISVDGYETIENPFLEQQQ